MNEWSSTIPAVQLRAGYYRVELSKARAENYSPYALGTALSLVELLADELERAETAWRERDAAEQAKLEHQAAEEARFLALGQGRN